MEEILHHWQVLYPKMYIVLIDFLHSPHGVCRGASAWPINSSMFRKPILAISTLTWRISQKYHLENVGKYHNLRQLWLVSGVKLMKMNSKLFSRHEFTNCYILGDSRRLGCFFGVIFSGWISASSRWLGEVSYLIRVHIFVFHASLPRTPNYFPCHQL